MTPEQIAAVIAKALREEATSMTTYGYTDAVGDAISDALKRVAHRVEAILEEARND